MSKFRALKEIITEYITERKKAEEFERHNVLVGKLVSVDDDSNIGEYSYIGSFTKIEHATIGRYVSIGDHCTIGPGEHRINRISTSYRIYKDQIGSEYYNGDDGKLGRITIGNDVWIGCNVTIRRGVNIGNGAVIGANSFVNRNVPPFSVWGGVPARCIRRRFDENRNKIIDESRWWECDLEEARSVIEKMEKKKDII